jgi:hypothetical protein
LHTSFALASARASRRVASRRVTSLAACVRLRASVSAGVLYDLINRTVSTRNEADLEALQVSCARCLISRPVRAQGLAPPPAALAPCRSQSAPAVTSRRDAARVRGIALHL